MVLATLGFGRSLDDEYSSGGKHVGETDHCDGRYRLEDHNRRQRIRQCNFRPDIQIRNRLNHMMLELHNRLANLEPLRSGNRHWRTRPHRIHHYRIGHLQMRHT